MSYNVKMVKIISGDTVLGIYDEEKKQLKDVAILQAMPTASGMQLAILPFGFPYEEDFNGILEEKLFIYEYKLPEELKNKYIEAKSNIKIAPTSGSSSGIII